MRRALGIMAGAIVGAGIALLTATWPAPLHHGWDSWWHDWWHAGGEIGHGWPRYDCRFVVQSSDSQTTTSTVDCQRG
jgi:hypothetical protein